MAPLIAQKHVLNARWPVNLKTVDGPSMLSGSQPNGAEVLRSKNIIVTMAPLQDVIKNSQDLAACCELSMHANQQG